MNEYKNKQTNITKLALSVRVYQQKHDGQTCIRMCLQSELSTELYEAENFVFNLLNRTLCNSNLSIFWQYFTISLSVVLNSSIKNRFITKSNDRMSEAFSGLTDMTPCLLEGGYYSTMMSVVTLLSIWRRST